MSITYLISPQELLFPGMDAWIDEGITFFYEDTPGWIVDHWKYDKQNRFHVQELYVKVLNKPGPIILVNPVQSKTRLKVRSELMTRSVILDNVQVSCAEDIWYALAEARRQTEEGFPMLPRKLVLAVLIIRKLIRQKQWGGKKGYLWADNLPHGGIPPIFSQLVLTVANDLCQHDLLVSKRSQGMLKYGLNAKHNEAVHAAANGEFRFERLREVLERDREAVSAAYLKEEFLVEKFAVTPPSGDAKAFINIQEAITYVRTEADGNYEVCVHFNGGRKLWDRFTQKAELLIFLQAFS